MDKQPKLIEMAQAICKECIGYRTQEVELVQIKDNWHCPFRYFSGGSAVMRGECHLSSPGCRGDSFPEKCPLLKAPFYHKGRIIMARGVKYKHNKP